MVPRRGLGEELVHEGGALVNEAPGTPSPHNEKVAIYELGSGSSPDPEPNHAGPLLSELPASRTVTSRFLLLLS